MNMSVLAKEKGISGSILRTFLTVSDSIINQAVAKKIILSFGWRNKEKKNQSYQIWRQDKGHPQMVRLSVLYEYPKKRPANPRKKNSGMVGESQPQINRWINLFKGRHGIKFKQVCCESADIKN